MYQEIRFLFRPEYEWPTGKKAQPQPFFVVPSWWRRFIFHVLTARAITVYHYYLSIMDTHGIAFPTVEQIGHDLGLSDKESIRKAISRLVECGFLLKPTTQERAAYRMANRPVYQRPCAQYTLKTLLDRNEINGELYATTHKLHSEHSRSSESVVRAGLKFLLGADYAYYEHALGQTGPAREKTITKVLEAILERELSEMQEARHAKLGGVTGLDNDTILQMPEAIRAAFGLGKPPAETPSEKKARRRKKASV